MILIQSNHFEYSTSEVIKWIIFRGKQFIRLNASNLAEDAVIKSIKLPSSATINYEGREIDLEDVTAYWHRRGKIKFHDEVNYFEKDEELNNTINDTIEKELKKYSEFLYKILEDKPRINSLGKATVNKLDVLKEAERVGLKTPISLVTNEKASLKEFISRYDKVICKPISTIQNYFVPGEGRLMSYTTLIEPETIEKLEAYFFPSFFQQYIEKKYELRSFYFRGEFYTMAIFSQSAQQTVVDFRNYNYKSPNRCVPFALPQVLEQKLKLLMQNLDLDCGSIDLIYNENNSFFFLEVNPVGQFGMVSYPCNYYLEEKIATFLCNQTKKSNSDEEAAKLR